MFRFKFRKELITDQDWDARCNELGADGWNVMHMDWREGDHAWMCYFRQTKSGKDQFDEAWAQPLSEEAKAELLAVGERWRNEATA